MHIPTRADRRKPDQPLWIREYPHHVRIIAKRHRLSLPVASIVSALAGIGGAA